MAPKTPLAKKKATSASSGRSSTDDVRQSMEVYPVLKKKEAGAESGSVAKMLEGSQNVLAGRRV